MIILVPELMVNTHPSTGHIVNPLMKPVYGQCCDLQRGRVQKLEIWVVGEISSPFHPNTSPLREIDAVGTVVHCHPWKKHNKSKMSEIKDHLQQKEHLIAQRLLFQTYSNYKKILTFLKS